MNIVYRKPYVGILFFLIVLTTAICGSYLLRKSEKVPPWVEDRWSELTSCPRPHYPKPKPLPKQNREIYIKMNVFGQTIKLTKSEAILSTALFIALLIIYKLI